MNRMKWPMWFSLIVVVASTARSQAVSWPSHANTAWFGYMTNEYEQLRTVGAAAVMPNANQKAALALQDEFGLRYMKLCAVAETYKIRLPYVRLTARESLLLSSFRTGAMSPRDLESYRVRLESVMKSMEGVVYSTRDAVQNAEYSQWAKDHPNEAQNRIMESRINNAMLQNQQAAWIAQSKEAELEEQAARQQLEVQRARLRSRNAEARANAAEDELLRRGLNVP